KKLRIAIPSTAVFLFALILSQQIWQAHKASSSTSLKQNMDAGFETLSLKFYKIFPISVFMKYADARSFQNGIKDYTKNTQRFKFNAWKKNDDSKEVYVVVIGETSRADHWEINGYNRNTNPLLAKEKNLVSFSDVASCGNLTSFCVPLLLTGLPPEKFNDYANHKSFLTAFKEAGFYTVWLSNQNTVNLGLPYPSDADSLVSLHTSFDYSNGYDEKLLPLLDNVLALNKPKILIVMHTLGSHFRYNYRYPKSFEKFTPAFRENVDYGLMNKSNLPTIINTYDNSILYTDYILSSVIKRLKKIETPASMLYISDHGENLCDDSRELFYHGSGYATKWETQVPFLVWYSDFYKQKDVINNLNKNKNKKISAVSFFPTVLGVAGIHYKGENPVLNLGDSNYFSPKVRMIINMDMKPVKYIN
ncbi:MAG: phosphoethanolamine transferase, partial [Bacteroidetes bacterium]|nr:phosphoethanolamine transferase [Bacteroidota bacterium]